ncbi:hypothetical protein MNBD_GAMMA12-390 [hydrothermal vent metagenome]|uniref:Uncharacterized protein n=1 Tax=hydrothermal vent metagenome TaxID=652676 RepID=A0A3B0ZCK7_9ZZZZ
MDFLRGKVSCIDNMSTISVTRTGYSWKQQDLKSCYSFCYSLGLLTLY